MTVLDQLIASLREASVFNRHDLAAPTVIVWTDGDRLWTKAIPLLQAVMPELLILDEAQAGVNQGPATWIRYQLSRAEWRNLPVIYLPGVSRQAFRSAAGFPPTTHHLYALQFQGQFWTQTNGKDWTPSAFMSSSEGGLGLDLARDKATLDALAVQFDHVLRTPVAELQRKRLEAADLHALVAGDPVRLALDWISDPDAVRTRWAVSQWNGFTALCREKFGLDPEKDGAISAVERLAAGKAAWNQVWDRYREGPNGYPGLRKALGRVQPQSLLDAANDRLPVVNTQQEDSLRRDLTRLAGLAASPAREALAHLCEDHARRASSVWAALGEAPLAEAAVQLSTMLGAIQRGFGPNDWAGLADWYVTGGWTVDAAARRALSSARDAQDWQAVSAALRAVYMPWLDTLAQSTVGLASTYPNGAPTNARSLVASPGTVVLFVDGLRGDVAMELRESFERAGCMAEFRTSWSALPTVTGTAKPAWKPLTDRLMGESLSEGFEPQQRCNGRPLRTPDFRRLLTEFGWSWIEPTASGDPGSAGWTEGGSFDRYGHDDGARLAWRVHEEVKAIQVRVRDLLRAGWKKAVVTTDHGWLLMPGGLPSVSMPAHLTATKWGRCAIAQPGAQHPFRRVPWFWGGQHDVVVPPGISAFKSGLEYAHGGLTVQEALVPELTVTLSKPAASGVRIESTRWAGLRLHIQLSGSDPKVGVDLRSRPADASSSLLPEAQRVKAPGADGKLSIQVENDDLIGRAAVVVVVCGGEVIDKKPVTVGED